MTTSIPPETNKMRSYIKKVTAMDRSQANASAAESFQDLLNLASSEFINGVPAVYKAIDMGVSESQFSAGPDWDKGICFAGNQSQYWFPSFTSNVNAMKLYKQLIDNSVSLSFNQVKECMERAVTHFAPTSTLEEKNNEAIQLAIDVASAHKAADTRFKYMSEAANFIVQNTIRPKNTKCVRTVPPLEW